MPKTFFFFFSAKDFKCREYGFIFSSLFFPLSESLANIQTIASGNHGFSHWNLSNEYHGNTKFINIKYFIYIARKCLIEYKFFKSKSAHLIHTSSLLKLYCSYLVISIRMLIHTFNHMCIKYLRSTSYWVWYEGKWKNKI